MDTEGEEESEANWESSIGIYTLLCVKQTASGKLVYSTGSSARCSVMTHRGRMGWVGERFKREWKFKKIRKKRFHFPKKDFIAAGVGEYDGSMSVALLFCDFA